MTITISLPRELIDQINALVEDDRAALDAVKKRRLTPEELQEATTILNQRGRVAYEGYVKKILDPGAKRRVRSRASIVEELVAEALSARAQGRCS